VPRSPASSKCGFERPGAPGATSSTGALLDDPETLPAPIEPDSSPSARGPAAARTPPPTTPPASPSLKGSSRAQAAGDVHRLDRADGPAPPGLRGGGQLDRRGARCFCTQIDVVLHEDGSCSVTDNGRGIPVDMHPTRASRGRGGADRPARGGSSTRSHTRSRRSSRGGRELCERPLGVARARRLAGIDAPPAALRAGTPVSRCPSSAGRSPRHRIGQPGPEIFTETTSFSYDILAKRSRLAFLNPA